MSYFYIKKLLQESPQSASKEIVFWKWANTKYDVMEQFIKGSSLEENKDKNYIIAFVIFNNEDFSYLINVVVVDFAIKKQIIQFREKIRTKCAMK